MRIVLMSADGLSKSLEVPNEWWRIPRIRLPLRDNSFSFYDEHPVSVEYTVRIREYEHRGRGTNDGRLIYEEVL